MAGLCPHVVIVLEQVENLWHPAAVTTDGEIAFVADTLYTLVNKQNGYHTKFNAKFHGALTHIFKQLIL